jgi:hypothetical protein
MRFEVKNIVYLVLVLVLVGCQQVPTFTVEGRVTNAVGKTLYLEHTALVKTSILDSCVLDSVGAFAFSASAPAYPDFYRLRVGSVSLPLAIDSTESVEVVTSLDSLSHTLCIKGSSTTLEIAALRAVAREGSRAVLREASQQLIVANPRSLSAYYAVFMKQGGEYVWDVFDPSDRRMFQAVATSFQTWMPEYERTKTLCGQVRDVMYAERSARQQQAVLQMIDDAENAFLDIALTDEQGVVRSLADLRGKVVVLDFSAIEMEQSMGYVFELRELYNRYNTSGLEIYSVSLDRNKLLWEDGVVNLPWVNVYAGENAVEVLTRYNVQSLPTLFLLDRKGNVQGRYTDFEQLGTDIRKYL